MTKGNGSTKKKVDEMKKGSEKYQETKKQVTPEKQEREDAKKIKEQIEKKDEN